MQCGIQVEISVDLITTFQVLLVLVEIVYGDRVPVVACWYCGRNFHQAGLGKGNCRVSRQGKTFAALLVRSGCFFLGKDTAAVTIGTGRLDLVKAAGRQSGMFA